MVKLSGPGCYAFMRGKQFLYIGSTSNLEERPLKKVRKGHENRYTAILQATHTKLFPCATLAKAKQMEELLIREHKPQFNLRQPLGEADMERTIGIQREIEYEIEALRRERLGDG